MTGLAWVFPGQGSQFVGMGAAVAGASAAASAVFEEVDSALGENLSVLAWNGPSDILDQTVNAQPALLASSMAILAAITERRRGAGLPDLQPAFAAGHSMGQYSAMVATGVLPLGVAAQLVRERGRFMQASGAGRPGAMAAIIGLDDDHLPGITQEATRLGVLTVANRNAPGQIVISGERPAVAAALRLARERGARRVVELPVSVAAHSPLMAEAAEAMRAALSTVAFRDPCIPLLANADGRLIRTAGEARAELLEHLTRGVDWVRAVTVMQAAGVHRFIEIGAGRVLTALIKRIAPDAEAVPTDDPNLPDHLAVPDLHPAGQPDRGPSAPSRAIRGQARPTSTPAPGAAVRPAESAPA